MAEIKEEPIENKGENQVSIEKTSNPMTYVFINIQVNVSPNEKEKTTYSLDWIERHIRREDYLYPGGYWYSEWVCEGVRRGYYPRNEYERKYGVGVGITTQDYGVGVCITPPTTQAYGIGVGNYAGGNSNRGVNV